MPILILTICTYVAVSVFNIFAARNGFDKKHLYLHLSKAYLYLGLIGSIACFVGGIIIMIFDSYAIAIVFFILATLFAFILSGYFGYRIYYDDEKIVYRKYFESYKVLHYKDIIRINYLFDIEIYTENSKLIIPSYMANSQNLLATVLQYVPNKATQKIKPKEKVRKFSDSVYRPGEFIFAFILMPILGTAGLAIVLILGEPEQKDYKLVLGTFICLAVVMYIYPILGIISAKRAHSSKFWRSVAKLLYREGYLKKE